MILEISSALMSMLFFALYMPDLRSGLRGHWPASTNACFIFCSCVVTLPS